MIDSLVELKKSKEVSYDTTHAGYFATMLTIENFKTFSIRENVDCPSERCMKILNDFPCYLILLVFLYKTHFVSFMLKFYLLHRFNVIFFHEISRILRGFEGNFKKAMDNMVVISRQPFAKLWKLHVNLICAN